MTVSTLLQTYMSEGTHATRPATPAVGANGIAVYYETDTLNTFIYDSAGATWVQVNTAGGAGTVATFDGTTSGVMGQTMFAGASAVVTTVNSGDMYEVKAILRRNTTGGSFAGIALTKTKNASDGYLFAIQNDGNLTLQTVAGGLIRSSGTGVIVDHVSWSLIQFRIGFTASTGWNHLDWPPAGNIQADNTLDFTGGNLWIAAGSAAAVTADIGKVVITKLN